MSTHRIVHAIKMAAAVLVGVAVTLIGFSLFAVLAAIPVVVLAVAVRALWTWWT